MTRNMDEIIDSMERVCEGEIDNEEKPLLEKLNRTALRFMDKRDDVDYITVSYNRVIKNPHREIEKINNFLGGMLGVIRGSNAVDPKLYRDIRQ